MSGKYPGGFVTLGAPAGFSVAFDGTGDYLTVPSSTPLTLGSGDWTIEFWLYVNALPAAAAIYNLLDQRPTSTNGVYPNIALKDTGAIRFYVNSVEVILSSASAIAINTWYHVALCKSSTSTRLFINGVQSGSTYTDSNNYLGSLLAIAASSFNIGNSPLNGYLSNFRTVKGTALYTTTFTPPTQLFNITNTSLLTCNSPTIIDQSNNAATITTVGDAKVSNFTPFAGYTATPPNPNTQVGTSGIWSIDEASFYMAQNQWPMPYPRQSLRFNSADSAYLGFTPSVAGNRKTWTLAVKVKRSALGRQNIFANFNSTAGSGGGLEFNASDQIRWTDYAVSSATTELITTQVFRDVGSWYDIVFAYDTTQATASDRMKLYINGVQVTAFGTATYPTLNYDGYINTASQAVAIGRAGSSTSIYLNAYLTDFNFVDGLALPPSSFGQTDANTGAWIPQNYTGAYGTNGFKLTFQNNTDTTATTLGKDWSGLGNNWTPTNFSVAAGVNNDSLVDSPWNFGTDFGNGGEVRTNYPTWNPLLGPTPLGGTFTDGNLFCTTVNGDHAHTNMATPTTGKWYWEFTMGSSVLGNGVGIALTTSRLRDTSSYYYGAKSTGTTGNLYTNGATSTYGANYTTNDVIGVALNLDAGTLTFYKNGVSQGVAASSVTGSYDAVIAGGGAQTTSAYINFGQRPFAFPLAGFKSLCAANLPKPAVGATSTNLAGNNFNAVLYTGNGTTTGNTQAITGVGFQPDLVWIKSRSSGTQTHVLVDAVRGANKLMYSPLTDAEFTATNVLNSFDANGFTTAYNSSYTAARTNENAVTYAAWAWNAGNSGASNTNGSITSTVRANAAAGISVVTYTGTGANATVGHGLGVAPKLIIAKNRASVQAWAVYNKSIGAGNYLFLNTTQASTAGTAAWNNTDPTANVFSVGTAGETNGNGNGIVAYCFAEVAGFSSFGSYTGNGNADGPFVYTGFRPRYVMIKQTSGGGGSWELYDTARDTYNQASLLLEPNSAGAQQTAAGYVLDILSNGFKLRGTGSGINTSTATYIYMTFAETPFNYSRAR